MNFRRIAGIALMAAAMTRNPTVAVLHAPGQNQTGLERRVSGEFNIKKFTFRDFEFGEFHREILDLVYDGIDTDGRIRMYIDHDFPFISPILIKLNETYTTSYGVSITPVRLDTDNVDSTKYLIFRLEGPAPIRNPYPEY